LQRHSIDWSPRYYPRAGSDGGSTLLWLTVRADLFHTRCENQIAVIARNLLDRERERVNVLPFPFDYRQETRRVLVSLRYDV
jgi:hypothetical protein